MTHPTPKAHPATRLSPTQVESLDQLLRDLLDEHTALLTAMHQHRESMRAADAQAIDLALRRQRAALGRLGELDRRRQQFVLASARGIPRASGATSLTLGAIAAHAPEPARTSLLNRAHEVRQVMHKVREEQTMVRLISQNLLAHMEGLMRQVAQKLSHAGVYSNRGCVEAANEMACALDLKS